MKIKANVAQEPLPFTLDRTPNASSFAPTDRSSTQICVIPVKRSEPMDFRRCSDKTVWPIERKRYVYHHHRERYSTIVE